MMRAGSLTGPFDSLAHSVVGCAGRGHTRPAGGRRGGVCAAAGSEPPWQNPERRVAAEVWRSMMKMAPAKVSRHKLNAQHRG